MVPERDLALFGPLNVHLWIDAHHIIHWVDGGPTALDNLVSLCRPHIARYLSRAGGSISPTALR
jgi:hypothetical protein